MDKYESFLMGGADMMMPKHNKGNGMTHADRLKNLAKARAVRAANLKAKKSGAGQYNQDYTDESQINYAGSPLDMYYLNTPAEQAKERGERGEVGGRMMGCGRMGCGGRMHGGRSCGCGIESELIKKSGGKMHKSKMVKAESESESDSDEDMMGGKRKSKGTAAALAFMKNSNHSGMSMPTKEQIKRGGAVKKSKKMTKIRPPIDIEELKGGATVEKLNIPEAIKVLAQLASKFGLKLVK